MRAHPSGAEQPALQQRLQVAPAIDDQHHRDVVVQHPVDDAVRLEEHLAIALDAKRQQLGWECAPFGLKLELSALTLQLVQHVLCRALRVVFGDPAHDLAQIALRYSGDVDAVGDRRNH